MGYKLTSVSLLLLVATAIADSSAGRKVDAAKAKYEQTAQKAADALWATVIIADRTLLNELETAVAMAKGADAALATAARDQAKQKLQRDQQSLSEHKPILEIALNEADAGVAAGKLQRGMTEAEAGAAIQARGKKENVNVQLLSRESNADNESTITWVADDIGGIQLGTHAVRTGGVRWRIEATFDASGKLADFHEIKQ